MRINIDPKNMIPVSDEWKMTKEILSALAKDETNKKPLTAKDLQNAYNMAINNTRTGDWYGPSYRAYVERAGNGRGL